MSAVTICISCRHFRNLEPHSPRAGCFYNHICRATPLPVAVDPLDGETKPYGVNDLGTRYFSPERPYAYCRNVNDGNCPKWQAKPDLMAQFK